MKYTYEQPDYLDVNGARHLVQELKKYIQDIMNGKIDISQYATKDELSSAVSSIDLSGYALKGEIPSLDGYAKTTDIPSVEGLATKSYVDENIAKVATSGDIDLSNYVTKDTVYTKAQTDALIPSVPSKISQLENDSNYLSSIPEEYVTDTELNAKGYLTEHQDLSAYALKTEIPTVPSLDGYATTEYVNNAVANVPTTDLSNYYTKSETYSKTEVDTLVANSGGSSSGGSSGGASNVYSTEETAIGTWIDGSTIYRKVIEVGKLASVSSGNYSTVTTIFSDVACGELLRMTGIIKYGTTTRIVVDGGFSNLQLNPSTTHSTYIKDVEKSRLTLIGSSTSVKLWYGADWGGYNYTLVVEYTKSA